MIDVNDAMRAGYSLAQIKVTAQPVDMQEVLARRGLLVLRRTITVSYTHLTLPTIYSV